MARLGLLWGLPVGLGLVFAGLLAGANPVIDIWAERLGATVSFDIGRVLFWLGMAFMLWPVVVIGAMQQRLRLGVGPMNSPALPGFFNGGSVARSLVVFNAVFAVQSLADAVYLWAGAALPQGMSYAQYAHRGAYPLLVAALLAGAFAVLTRPLVAGDRGLRLLLLVWMGQTVVLVASSLLRLELYVGVYGLTRLRMAAAIWMAVVAAGLGLVIWQIMRDHAARWMLGRAALLGVVVLWGCCFVSFDAVIARFNLSHDVVLDEAYLCQLGPGALPAIVAYRQAGGVLDCWAYGPVLPVIADWREWGFREWRLLRSLSGVEVIEAEAVYER